VRALRSARLAAAILMAAATVARAQAPAKHPALPSPQDKLLLVGSGTVSTVTVFQAKADRLSLLRTIETGKGPEQIVVTADGRTAYVLNGGDDSISVIDLSTLTVARTITHPHLQRPADPPPVRGVSGMAVTPDGKKLYVTSRFRKLVLVMTPAGDVTKEIPGDDVSSIAVSADGARMYFTSDRPQVLFAVDTATDAVVGQVRTGRGPGGITFTPDGKALLLTNTSSDTLQVVNPRTLEIESTTGVGRAARSAAVSPDGRLAFVGTRMVTGSSVDVVDLRREAPRKANSLPVGTMIHRLLVSDDGAYLYMTCASTTDPRDNVIALDLLTMEIVRYARGGANASALAFRK
jgi:YVTN family beta-propeller protein